MLKLSDYCNPMNIRQKARPSRYARPSASTTCIRRCPRSHNRAVGIRSRCWRTSIYPTQENRKPSKERAFIFTTASKLHCDAQSGFSKLFCHATETSSAEILRRKVPVRNVPERFDELRTRIAIVDVIRVFPHVDGQQRLRIGGDRKSTRLNSSH